MQKIRLSPDDLLVHSFETSAARRTLSEAEAAESISIQPNDPTPATWCRICPTF